MYCLTLGLQGKLSILALPKYDTDRYRLSPVGNTKCQYRSTSVEFISGIGNLGTPTVIHLMYG